MDLDGEDVTQYVEATYRGGMEDNEGHNWEITFWEMFELIFKEGVTLKVMIPTIEDMIALSIMNEDLEAKRVWSKILDKVKVMITTVQKKHSISRISFVDLKKSLGEEKNLMKHLNDILIRKEEKESFKKFYNEHAKNLPSSSRELEYIGTSSASLPTETVQADVSPFKKVKIDESPLTITGMKFLKENRPGDVLEHVFQNQTQTSNTAQISQFISLQIGKKWSSIKSPGERGFNVVKLEMYPFQMIQDKREEDWSKYASKRCVFLTHSERDTLEVQVKILLDQVAKNIDELIKKASRLNRDAL